MNINALINMIIRMVIRQLVNHGIRGGLARMGRGGDADAPPSEADRDQAQRAKTTAKNARQAMRATRRINRF